MKGSTNDTVAAMSKVSFGKEFWTIPGLAVYVYVVTILFQFGFLSYFNLPSSFIGASIQANTIYFYQLFTSLVFVLASFKWWWIILGPVFFWGGYQLRRYLTWILVGVMFLFFYVSYSFGQKYASVHPTFITVPANCVEGDVEAAQYIVPVMSDNIAVLLPVDAGNKLLDGLYLKNPTELNCRLDFKYIGPIKS
jgi:hypothetical protein